MNKFLLMALVVPAYFACSGPASAFGHPGHRLIGEIADRRLHPNALAKVREILGPELHGLQEVAVWPDCARSVKHDQATNMFHYKLNDPYRSPVCAAFEVKRSPAEAARMEDYVGRNWTNCDVHSEKDPCHAQYHYTDVSIQHSSYSTKYEGTSKNDIFAALKSAIAFLEHPDQPASGQFSFKDSKDALMLMAHLLGDIHQPLHVGAVYLDPDGNRVDPDAAGTAFDPKTATRGGNKLKDPKDSKQEENLHHEWDALPSSLAPKKNAANQNAMLQGLVAEAKAVPQTKGGYHTWVSKWATESVVASSAAYDGLTFTKAGVNDKSAWFFNPSDDAAYRAMREKMQREQIVKAGERLADLLNAIWP